MTLPTSERFLAAVATQLATILVSNGYQTDAGQRAVRAQHVVDEQDAPAVVLWEGDETPADQTDGVSAVEVSLDFTVDGMVVADQADTGAKLGLIKADIKRCVMGWYASGAALDPLAQRDNRSFGLLTWQGASPKPRTEGSSVEGVTVRFNLRYPETVSNPYAGA